MNSRNTRKRSDIIAALETEYRSIFPSAVRMANCVKDELSSLVEQNNISLAVPLEYRVKEWSSISEKLERVALQIDQIYQLNDLVGVRLITLFTTDIEKLDGFIRSTFIVLNVENAFDRLNENQFGYQSMHYIIELPKQWLTAPTNKGLDKLKAEIQVRTVSQHTWAAASHKLQYKQESAVPADLRRSINRLSALLETVDLELERILQQKSIYLDKNSQNTQLNSSINSDIIKIILDRNFPIENRDSEEDYSDLIFDLNELNIFDSDVFEQLIIKHKSETLKEEKKRVRNIQSGREPEFESERVDRGVFYTHVGLARTCLSREYGHDKMIEIQRLKKEPDDE
jgi:ppGpp synthetase/RelA/SpoT-type nucleotidyltranferase